MWFLAFSSLRFRWLSFVGVFVTVMAAATLVTATGFLLEAGIRGATPPERLAGADIVVTADQTVREERGSGEDNETVSTVVIERVRLPADLADEISSIPGVVDVVAEASFPAHLVIDEAPVSGPHGTPSLGHAWTSASLTPFRLDVGRAPTRRDEIVIDAGLARRTALRVGDVTSAAVAGRVVKLSVSGVAKPAGQTALREQSAIFFFDDAAHDFFGSSDRTDLFAVSLADGAAREKAAAAIRRTVGPHRTVLTGDDRGRAEFLDSSDASLRLIAISGSLGGIALFVAALVLAGMITLFVQQRQREIALLRAIGGLPRQVRRLLARETLTVTLLGALAGVWPGFWLGELLALEMRDRGLLPGHFQTQADIWPAVAAVAAVVVVSQVAAYAAGRRAGKVRPIEALTVASSSPRGIGWVRASAGLLAAGGTGALFLVAGSVRASIAPALTPATLMGAIVTVALLAPLLVILGVNLVGLVTSRLFGASGFLAFANVRSQVRRVASAVIPLALTVGVACMTLFQQSTLEEESKSQRGERITAEHVITAGAAGLPTTVVEELAAKSPGAVAGLADTSVYGNFELDPYAAKVVMGDSLEGLLDLDVSEGSLGKLRKGQVALSTDAAAGLDAKLGQPVHLRLGDGAVHEPRLVATYERSAGFADALLPWASVSRHVTHPLLSLVLAADGNGSRKTAASVAKLHRDHPSTVVGGPEIIAAAEDANAATQAWVNYMLLGLVIAFAAFAVVNTLMLAIRDRSREYALLQLIGASRLQVRRMMRIEALILILLGWAIGGAVAAVTLMPFAQSVTGSPSPDVPLLSLGVVLLGAAVLAWLATMAPTRATMRARPVDAIGIRD
jgi:putative ABC transport system permease protein